MSSNLNGGGVEEDTEYCKKRIMMRLSAACMQELQEILQNVEGTSSNVSETKSLMRKHIYNLCVSNKLTAEYVLRKTMAVRCAFNYICVIDFEATCIQKSSKTFYPHEIIEFPAALIDIQNLKVVDQFHSFVKPALYPELSDFCTNLTGISQNDVNKAPSFEHVLRNFFEWIRSCCKADETFIICTDGSCDINKFLSLQCIISQIDLPECVTRWIDVKTAYCKSYNVEKARLYDMLQSFGMNFEGRLHSGKDDTYNIARVVIAMLKDGVRFKVNAHISHENYKVYRNRLHAYQRAKAHEEKRTRNLALSERNECCRTEKYVETSSDIAMDVDPELVGCERLLSKYKNARLPFLIKEQ